LSRDNILNAALSTLMDSDTHRDEAVALARRLRAVVERVSDNRPGWREDVRLFLFAWAAGFLFFFVVCA
jgi:hypothetical protein